MDNSENPVVDWLQKNQSPKDKLKILRTCGVSTTEGNELTIWDKKKWLVLEDFWLGHATQEQTDLRLQHLIAEEREKNESNGESSS